MSALAVETMPMVGKVGPSCNVHTSDTESSSEQQSKKVLTNISEQTCSKVLKTLDNKDLNVTLKLSNYL